MKDTKSFPTLVICCNAKLDLEEPAFEQYFALKTFDLLLNIPFLKEVLRLCEMFRNYFPKITGSNLFLVGSSTSGSCTSSNSTNKFHLLTFGFTIRSLHYYLKALLSNMFLLNLLDPSLIHFS
jgi:hypothetical protein